MAKCPHCGSSMLGIENNHQHCVACGRNFRLVPFRSEKLRLERVEGSKQGVERRGPKLSMGA